MTTLSTMMDNIADPQDMGEKLEHLRISEAFGQSKVAAIAATGTYADAQLGAGRQWNPVRLWVSTRRHGLDYPILDVGRERTYDEAMVTATRINERIVEKAKLREGSFIGYGRINPQTNELTMDDGGAPRHECGILYCDRLE